MEILQKNCKMEVEFKFEVTWKLERGLVDWNFWNDREIKRKTDESRLNLVENIYEII